ncbi:GtrA family protein [Streptomyces sp. NPDC097941]|uniref:GtrA family protein n=1 Tax=Streptomyces sp. NPDC097941 TaxID=3155685 RepID=UPI003326CF95
MEPQTADRTESPSRLSPASPTAPAAPGPLASFVRFVVCGGGIGVLSSFAVPLVALTMPWALANAVITVASTLLCTELHALFTFGTGRRPGRRRHLQSSGSAAAAYAVTGAAMFLLHAVQSSPSMLTEQVAYLSASALAGIGRFLVLRLFVFGSTRKDNRQARTVTLPRPSLPRAAVSTAC